MDNRHLVPDLIRDLVRKYVEAKNNERNVNETLNLQMRLEAIEGFISEALASANNNFLKR